MTTNAEPIDNETLEMIRTSFHNVKVNPNMPSNIDKEDIKNNKALTLLLAGENDVLFPGEKVIKRAKEIIPNVETYLLQAVGICIFLQIRERNT